MRRRRRAQRRAPSASDTEYFSDSPANRDDPSDSSAHDSDSPSPSGSTLPAPSSPAGLKDAPDLSDDDTRERAWYEFDLSVALALLSPVVNWLTGSDLVKNVFLVLLIVFYLHQIIEVPWTLYLASRPRRPMYTFSTDSTADKYHRAAQSELHTLEIFYLTLSILSPFLGATLLRTVFISFSGPSTVSWFSLSLFVLATGMRPWKHAIRRLRQRTADLHTVIHYPPSELQRMDALVDRIARLEAELDSLHKQSKSFNSNMYEHVEEAIGMIEISARRQEKRVEVSKAYVEGRLVKLEQNVEALLERMEIRADIPALYRIMAQIPTLVSALIEYLAPILPTWAVQRWCRGNISRSPRSSPKLGRSRSSIKLETIPEVATFQPKSSAPSSHHLRFGLASRICGLVTFPLRRVLAFLLAGQRPASTCRASLS